MVGDDDNKIVILNVVKNLPLQEAAGYSFNFRRFFTTFRRIKKLNKRDDDDNKIVIMNAVKELLRATWLLKKILRYTQDDKRILDLTPSTSCT